jgi:hypothetical protein
MMTFQAAVAKLSAEIQTLWRNREADVFVNDLFEAVSDLLDLSQHIAQRDERVDYPLRVAQELDLWARLRHQALTKASFAHYADIFAAADAVLEYAKGIKNAPDGYLGVLRTIRRRFSFVVTKYHFVVVDQDSLGLRFSSSDVYLDLRWATHYSLSCSFGRKSDPANIFDIADLMFLYADQRYRTLPDELRLETEADVERWFEFVAEILETYGDDLFRNRAGFFERLLTAQKQRDLEHTQEMDRLYGHRSPG